MDRGELQDRRLVVAANRGPVSFHSDPSGEPIVTRGLGGLVTVILLVYLVYALVRPERF